MIWLPIANIIQQDLASNVGGMDRCTTSFSIMSPSLIIIAIELFIHIGHGAVLLGDLGNQEALPKINLGQT